MSEETTDCRGSLDPDAHDWHRVDRDGMVVQVYCLRCRLGPLDLLRDGMVATMVANPAPELQSTHET